MRSVRPFGAHRGVVDLHGQRTQMVHQLHAALAEELAAAATTLRTRANELQSLISGFQVDDGTSTMPSDPSTANGNRAATESAPPHRPT